MRLGKCIALALTLLLMSNATLSACNTLRTPYERQKIAENGGTAKKESDKGSDAGGGGEGEGGKGAGGEKKGEDEAKTQQKQADKEKVSPKRAETKGERRERKKGQGVLYLAPKTLEDQTPKLAYEQKLSSAVSQLAGVGGATVLLDEEHRAYVALSTEPDAKSNDDALPIEQNPQYNVKTEGDIPKDVQERIAVKLRQLDGQIGLVQITSDPHHADTIERYAQNEAQGANNDMNTQALTEHIQDIWK